LILNGPYNSAALLRCLWWWWWWCYSCRWYSRVSTVFSGVDVFVCLSVCLFFRTISQKLMQLETCHNESCKRIYFGDKRSKVKVTRHPKIIAGVSHGAWWVLGFFSSSSDDDCTAFAQRAEATGTAPAIAGVPGPADDAVGSPSTTSWRHGWHGCWRQLRPRLNIASLATS